MSAEWGRHERLARIRTFKRSWGWSAHYVVAPNHIVAARGRTEVEALRVLVEMVANR